MNIDITVTYHHQNCDVLLSCKLFINSCTICSERVQVFATLSTVCFWTKSCCECDGYFSFLVV